MPIPVAINNLSHPKSVCQHCSGGPIEHNPEKEKPCWAMEWSSWDDPSIGALRFPAIPGTREALRTAGESPSKVQGP